MTKIKFENSPSTKTPINAENLNKLNNVVINSTEPTTGEEVWLQKGKNLFNKNGANKIDGYFNDGNQKIEYGVGLITIYIPCESNTTYTVQKIASSRFCVGYTTEIPAINITTRGVITRNGATKITITTDSDANYLCAFVYHSTHDSSLETILNSIQIEQGETATSYEPYIDKKIYTKNDNGVYEKFYNEAEHNKEIYSTGEQRIGTWLGKPLYRKVITSTVTSSNASTSLEIDLSSLNAKDVTYFYEIVRQANYGGVFDLPFYDLQNGTYIVSQYNSINKKLIITNTLSWLVNATIDIVLEYTKTTD